MKILWVVNMVLPDLAEHLGVGTSSSGTWMFELSHSLSAKDDIDLAVACVYGNKYDKCLVNGIKYYLIPGTSKSMMFYDKNLSVYWKKIIEDFNPDIINLHGTEYSHGLSLIEAFPEKTYLLTIQGIINEIAPCNAGNLKLSTLLHYRTKRESLKFNGMIENKLLLKRNSKYENKIIRGVRFATGRTDWDKDYILKINPCIKYYRCFYNLRTEFYSAAKWNYDDCEHNSIYCSTAGFSPLKGGNIVIEALGALKKKGIDFQAYFLGDGKDGYFEPSCGFSLYLNHLIAEYGIEDNIRFLSRLDSKGVISIMQKCNALVVASAMENASATLREGLSLGIPCISSNRGGMLELSQGGTTVLQYEYDDSLKLAELIAEVFSSPEKSRELSLREIRYSDIIHNRENNLNNYYNMYKDIYYGKSGE